MSRVFDRIYGALTGLLPAALAGHLDLLRPSLRGSWGGPLNGQERRREMVQELAQAMTWDRVVEAGTYRGTTTEYLAAVFEAPITTIEVNPRYYAYSRRRLAGLPSVSVVFEDSRNGLRALGRDPAVGRDGVFIYLDSHGETELPLSEEIEIIAATWLRAVVMVDDFLVPDDSGYVYMEDYGPSLPLSEDRLPFAVLGGWSLFYPSAASAAETGAKRGCCVLASPALSAASAVPSLRLSRVI